MVTSSTTWLTIPLGARLEICLVRLLDFDVQVLPKRLRHRNLSVSVSEYTFTHGVLARAGQWPRVGWTAFGDDEDGGAAFTRSFREGAASASGECLVATYSRNQKHLRARTLVHTRTCMRMHARMREHSFTNEVDAQRLVVALNERSRFMWILS